MARAYYNEIDQKAAAWLRELISAGLIANGDVDTRSIEDVTPNDLVGYTQCHFFAGIGVWSYALRRAGWPDSKPVWTGSCPCQPFSSAGKGAGFVDERHLWPALFHLISQRQPDVFFGEQVASKDGLAWLDLVQADLEAASYAGGAVDLCAAGVGAPHIRQRLWLAYERMVHSDGEGFQRRPGLPKGQGQIITLPGRALRVGNAIGDRRQQGGPDVGGRGAADGDREELELCHAGKTGGLADHDGGGRQPRGEGREAMGHRATTQPDSSFGRVGNSDGINEEANRSFLEREDASSARDTAGPGPVNGYWRDADWLFCRDGKWRPVEPGSQPLADGAPARVGRLRGFGNAINAEAAVQLISAYQEQ